MVCLVIMAAMATAAAISVMNSRNTANIHATKGRARVIQNDAWGHAFAIHCDETAVHLLSPGPDAVLGNDDDIGF